MADLLGTFEQAVLLAILHLETEAYGRAVLHQAQEMLKRNVSAGSVYTTLDRLEARGLVSSRLAEGTPVRGGRARRYYSVAGKGIEALSDARSALTAIWAGVQLPSEVQL
jgi:DNA-binding PadR family transcriptional regulator